MTQFQENAQTDERTEGWNDRWTDGRTEGQTLFYRTLPTTARGTKRTAMNGARSEPMDIPITCLKVGFPMVIVI